MCVCLRVSGSGQLAVELCSPASKSSSLESVSSILFSCLPYPELVACFSPDIGIDMSIIAVHAPTRSRIHTAKKQCPYLQLLVDLLHTKHLLSTLVRLACALLHDRSHLSSSCFCLLQSGLDTFQDVCMSADRYGCTRMHIQDVHDDHVHACFDPLAQLLSQTSTYIQPQSQSHKHTRLYTATDH